MTTKGAVLFIFIATASLVTCACPREKIHAIGDCAFRLECTGDINGISLPEKCQGSTNYPITVDLTLKDPIDKYYDPNDTDTDFLASITTFRAVGEWSWTMPIFQCTPRLQNLILKDNRIEKISEYSFYYLSRLEVLDLSYNRLVDIEDVFQFEMHPNKLQTLSLAHNAIEEIPGDAFEELLSLVELDLSYNSIADLNEEPFFNLTSLKVLRLNNNKIKNLNGAVNNLQNLKHLYLRGNQIQHIDVESLKIILHLETFDVSWNQLEEIKPIMFSRHWKHFGSHSVCKIILSQNLITHVPNANPKEMNTRFTRHLHFSSRANPVDVLTELDLSSNAISNIEYNAFRSLLKLISLDLSSNKLIDFVVNADDLIYVRDLNLSSNWITHLSLDSFSLMKNLQNLDLSHNKLDDIPSHTFSNNRNLKTVNMTFNEIEKLDNLRINMLHPDGGVLDLSNNGLTRLRIPSGQGLRMVMLNSNQITESYLISLTYQTDLKHLDMSNNSIRELNETSLHLPYSLSYLDLNHNFIERVGPSSFHKLGHLRTLRLAQNQLEDIEYGAFNGLIGLENLDLSYNRIRQLDSKLLMDLKSLTKLSLRFNGLYVLDYKAWLSHKLDLTVYLEGNNFTCDWLGTALIDYNNGFSKMRPAALWLNLGGHSLEGIPCVQGDKEIGEYVDPDTRSVMADERLLVTSQKILEAIKEQTYYLTKFIWRNISEENMKGKVLPSHLAERKNGRNL